MEPTYIIKSSGERESWDPRKLERSLRAAKADEHLVREIVEHVTKDAEDGMSTRDIYVHAFALLKRRSKPVAAQYSLKRAITQLGPSGFPFERFVAQILKAQGYHTKVGVMVQGSCVTHEVDVVAEKDDERILVEAKFHNSPEVKSDVKVSLYVHARFEDIKKKLESDDGGAHYNRAWLITNTSFTTEAIKYGTCAGLALTGWNYPKGYTLQDIVQRTETHPITCLITLSNMNKNQLLNQGIVLCNDILTNPHVLENIGMNKSRITTTLTEIKNLYAID